MAFTNKLYPLLLLLGMFILPELSAQEEVTPVPDKMPEFKGGITEMYKFIYTNIQYPVEARKKGIMGKVVVQFAVDTVGGATEAVILRGIGGGCDEEVLRIIQLMDVQKLWNPGMHEAKPVKVTFTLPIDFRLEGVEKKKKKKN